MVLFLFDLGCLVGFFKYAQFLIFTINSLTSCSNSKTTSTHTNTVAKPDPKKVLVAITRLCNNYKLFSFIQELEKGGSGSAMLHQPSILQEEETQ